MWKDIRKKEEKRVNSSTWHVMKEKYRQSGRRSIGHQGKCKLFHFTPNNLEVLELDVVSRRSDETSRLLNDWEEFRTGNWLFKWGIVVQLLLFLGY